MAECKWWKKSNDSMWVHNSTTHKSPCGQVVEIVVVPELFQYKLKFFCLFTYQKKILLPFSFEFPPFLTCQHSMLLINFYYYSISLRLSFPRSNLHHIFLKISIHHILLPLLFLLLLLQFVFLTVFLIATSKFSL